MRLTLRLLGVEVFHISTDAEPAEADAASLDGGTTASTPIGFTLPVAAPYEHETPPHTEQGWE